MIPVAKPDLGTEEAEAAAATVLSGWVSQGPQVVAFEAEFAERVDAAHACAVSNCTTALHLALLGVGVKEGDEVVTVSHSFIAGANAIRQCGATPVFVDIEANGYNVDPQQIRAAIGPRTAALLVVHQMGMPCDMAAVMAIAGEAGIAVVEDAACAAGSQIMIDRQWRPIGKPIGDVVCFSFHPRKVIATGEGGMLTTDRADLDAKFRLWRQHGMAVSDLARHGSRSVVFETYPERGYNYRMTDIQAAIGCAQLRRLSDIVARRRQIAERYADALETVDEVHAPCEPPFARTNWQSYCVRLDGSVDQYAVMQHMLDAGIATRRGVMCMHLEAAHADVTLRFPLPRSEAARDGSIILPMFAQLRDTQVDRVVDALRAALRTTRVCTSRSTGPLVRRMTHEAVAATGPAIPAQG